MTIDSMANLVRIKLLNSEPPDKREIEGLINAATDRLTDAQNSTLSFASRFDLAYGAAHGLALSKLRAAGYRSDKRYLVFQCLIHTANISSAQARVFSLCHDRRNLAEYEGHFNVDEPLLSELIITTKQLLELIKSGKS